MTRGWDAFRNRDGRLQVWARDEMLAYRGIYSSRAKRSDRPPELRHRPHVFSTDRFVATIVPARPIRGDYRL